MNLLPANLLWPFWVLPRTIILVLASYIPGSSLVGKEPRRQQY